MKQHQLHTNFNTEAVVSILEATKNESKNVICWRLVAGKKILADVKIRVFRKKRQELVIKATSTQSENVLRSFAIGNDKLNFYIPDSLILFQSEILRQENEHEITVKVPEIMAQAERRKFFRYYPEEHQDLSIQFSKENHVQNKTTAHFNKKLLDISAGGTAFLILSHEKKFFQENEVLKNIELKLEGKKYKVNLQILRIFNVKPTYENGLVHPGQKITAKFIKTEKSTIEKILYFVIENMNLPDVI